MRSTPSGARLRIAAALAAAVVVASAASAQFQRRGGARFSYGPRGGQNPAYDGAWRFCRIIFRDAPDGDGNGWFVDWPRADENLSFRFSELTWTSVSRGQNSWSVISRVARLATVVSPKRGRRSRCISTRRPDRELKLQPSVSDKGQISLSPRGREP